MTHLIDAHGHPIPYWEPRPGVYIPQECNAAFFGGRWDQTITVTREMAETLAKEWRDA
jgi:hypothetical protein